MEFRILGPMEVMVDGQPIDLGGTRERALLAVLLLSANHVVSVDRLVDDLWGEHPPETAVPTVRVFVSRLRKALRWAAGAEVIVTQSPGYLARVDPAALDLTRFQALAAQGHTQLTAGDAASAAAILREALGLWRGPALADLTDVPAARTAAVRLEEERQAALEDRVEADLACGHHRQLIPELEALTAAHPLRERLWAHRMVSLYRSGRQADALRAYQGLRALLAEDLGLEPTSALRQLEGAILRQDPALLDAAPPSEPAKALRVPKPSTVPMPALLTDASQIFVGRDDELRRLARLWKEAATGERRTALLTGEPGVGKTRLAAEMAVQAHGEGATVLAGRCDEDLGVPYQPFVQALRHFVDHTPTEELSARLGRYGGELSRLVPELAGRVSELPPPTNSDPETERYRLFDAVAGWLAAAGEEPLLFVLDDLQWAAKPTLLLLRHLLQSPNVTRILFVGTYRDTDVHHNHPLREVLADLRRLGDIDRLSLLGLDAAAVVAFMEQIAGHRLDEGDTLLAHAVYEETEGNPFFVREVLRHLAEMWAIERGPGRWGTRLPIDELGIPESVRDVVGRRLSRLSDAANQVLRTAAVIGSEFEVAVVRTAGQLDDDSVLATLEEAAGARLVIEASTGRYRFAHALVRDTLYHALSATRRVHLHRRVAEAIEEIHAGGLDDHLPALAHHYTRALAPAAGTTKAVTYIWRAGKRALAQLAHDEAAAHFRQALELLDLSEGATEEADTQRQELLIALGEAQRRTGDPVYRQTLLRAANHAQQHGDGDALARSALALSRGILASNIGGLDVEQVAVLEAALKLVGERETPQRARLLATLAHNLLYTEERERRLRLSDEALGVARRLGDAGTLAQVLFARYYTVATAENLAERLADTAELLRLAEVIGDPVTTNRAWWLRSRSLSEAGEVEEANRCKMEFERTTDELGQPYLRWVALWVQVGREICAGDFLEAERLSHVALETGRAIGQADAALIFAHEQFQLRWAQGRLGEVEGLLTDVVAQTPRIPGLRATLALFYCELERDEDARRLFEELAAARFAGIPSDYLWLRGTTDAAAVCYHLADASGADALYRLLEPFAGQFVVSFGLITGSVNHYLGLLGATLERFSEAETHFAAAHVGHERINAPLWLARTQLAWARMLVARNLAGDADRARKLLTEALTTARKLRLANVERRAVQLLTLA